MNSSDRRTTRLFVSVVLVGTAIVGGGGCGAPSGSGPEGGTRDVWWVDISNPYDAGRDASRDVWWTDISYASDAPDTGRDVWWVDISVPYDARQDSGRDVLGADISTDVPHATDASDEGHDSGGDT